MEKFDTTDPQFQTWVRGLLHDTNVKNLRITFTKSDGTDREMQCTLVENLIPSDKVPKGTGRVSTEETQRVFDLAKQEWRSFKWNAVKSIHFDI